MSNRITGVVQKVVCNAQGFYSLVINDVFYSSGKVRPNANEGDNVTFTATPKPINNKVYWNVDKNTIQVIGSAAPAKAGGAPSGYDARQASIIMQASIERALIAANGMLSAGVVSLDKIKEPDKVEAYLDLVDSLTMRFFEQGSDPDNFIAGRLGVQATGGADEDGGYNPTEA